MLRFTQNRRAGLQTGSIQFGRHFLAHLLWWHNGQAVRGLWLYQCVYCVVESFMTDVWRCLVSDVPYGCTISYGELAQLSGRARASRAVGQAMRRNCISLLIPCHRVICSNGQTGHYAGGRRDFLKDWLLTLEKSRTQRIPLVGTYSAVWYRSRSVFVINRSITVDLDCCLVPTFLLQKCSFTVQFVNCALNRRHGLTCNHQDHLILAND